MPLRGGFKPFNFENMISTYGLGWWPGHVPTTLGWFWVHARNTAHLRPRSKEWVKTKNLQIFDRA